MAGIFISYRRENAAGHAGRLFDRLAQHFGRDKVFMDVAGIEPGVDFVEAIDQAVGSCDVLIVVIGKGWTRAADAAGKRRLDDPNDFVRLEVTTALRRNVRVIPLLVDGAPLPLTENLPEDLQKLARRNAFELRDGRWESDTGLLVEALEKVLGRLVKPDRPAVRVEEAADRRRVRFVPMAIGAAVIGAFAIAGWVERKDDTPTVPRILDPTPTPAGTPSDDAAEARKEAEARAKREQVEAALRAADAALAKGDAPSMLARLEEARKAGADPAALDERRRRLRDSIVKLATAAASEAEEAVQKNDAASARAAVKRARDLKAQAEALDAARP